MTWVRRAATDAHTCDLPVASFGPAGSIGDLYRCDSCGVLWRIGLSCDRCDHIGDHDHPGVHQIGRSWRVATLWQRIRYRRRGREDES